MKGIIFLTVSALVYTIATTIIFYKKDTINKLENRIFKKLLCASIASMLMELLIVVTTDLGVLGTIVQKTFLICLVLWLSIFMLYTFAITTFDDKKSEEENIKKFKTPHILFIIVNIIIFICIYALPIEFVSLADDVKFTTGPSVNVVYIVFGVYVTFMSILILKNVKIIHKKGYIPIIALIILMLASGIIQKTHPEMLLTNALFGFVIYLMYHTIENPDLKMLNQVTLAKNQAEKSNRAKSEFISSISHQLKTPLNGVKGLMSYNLEFNDKLPEDIQDNNKEIYNYINELDNMISNMIAISKNDVDEVDMVETEYDLNEVVESVGMLFKYKIEEKGLKLITKVDDIKYKLIGDEDKVRRILANILDNAVKYTDVGKIHLSIHNEIKNNMCALTIIIEDTGIGIDEKTQTNIFKTFNRTKEKMEGNISGMGLGLSITNNLVKLLGGSMEYETEIDKGTKFVVNIKQKVGSKK